MGLIIVPPSGPSSDGVFLVRLWWGRPRSTTWNHDTHSRPGGDTGKGELSGFSPRNVTIIIPEIQLRLHLLQEVFLNSLCSPSDLVFPPLARVPSVSLHRWCGVMHSLLSQLGSSLLIHHGGQGLAQRLLDQAWLGGCTGEGAGGKRAFSHDHQGEPVPRAGEAGTARRHPRLVRLTYGPSSGRPSYPHLHPHPGVEGALLISRGLY